MLYIILGLLILHWIADFICQPRWMANEKSKRWDILTIHCFTYAIIIQVSILIILILSNISSTKFESPLAIMGITLFITHFIIDFVTSKMTAYYYQIGKTKAFWNTIGFDQILHIWILITVFQYLYLVISIPLVPILF